MSVYATLRQILLHPAANGKKADTIMRVFGWQIRKRLLHVKVIEKTLFKELNVRCHCSSKSASGAIYFDGWFDYHSMKFIDRYLKNKDAFIDVGANIGIYTLLAASKVGADGRVDAFEPQKNNYRQLCENVTLNRMSQVSTYRLAVSESAGEMSFLIEDGDSCGRLQASEEVSDREECVKTFALDSLLADRKYAMMKVDVEGAEPLVLMGAEQGIKTGNPPVMQLELDGYSRRYGFETEDVMRWLDHRGYQCSVYNANRYELTFTRRPWKLYPMTKERNVLAIHIDAVDEVKDRLDSGLSGASPTKINYNGVL